MGWETSVTKERSLRGPPTGVLPSIEIATKREHKAEISAAAVVRDMQICKEETGEQKGIFPPRDRGLKAS